MTTTPLSSLESQARIVLGQVREALAAVLAAISPPVTRPRDLCQVLGLHQTLAWKVFRIVDGPDLFADAQYIPGPQGMESFLDAAGARGVPAAMLDRAREAVGRFRALAGSRAGDRASLEMMLNGMVGDNRADGRALRKQGFRCASATWGVQMKARLMCKILHPGAQAGMMDVALIRGFSGMRRVRPGAPFTLARIVVLDNDGKARRQVKSEPIEPESVTSGVPIFRRFCSDPMPEIRVAPGPDGGPEQQLGEAPIGEAATVFSGEVMRSAVSRYRDAHNEHSNTAVVTRIPCEAVTIDLWAHRELFGRAGPRALQFGELCGTPWYKQAAGSAEALPLSDEAGTLGSGLEAARLAGVPGYRNVMRHAFSRLGWESEEFVLHRVSVDFPVVATALVLQMPLPAGPSSAT